MRRVPAGLAACVVLAVLHATVWAVITPTFQPPDEPVHVGYAQYVAKQGGIPDFSPNFRPPEDLSNVFGAIPWTILGKPTWDPAADRALDERLDGNLSSTDKDTGGGYASNNPPLYYAMEAPIYLANEAVGGDLLDAIFLMRLLSALLAGVAVGFVWLLLRELFPRTPWAWTAGAAALALQPMMGFIAGGVNNDNLLNACGAAFLYLTVRVLRRPPTVRDGLLLGLPVAAALLTKLSAFALLAALMVVLALLLLRASGQRAAALRAAVAAMAVAVVPFAIYIALAQRTANSATGGLGTAQSYYTVSAIRDQISYIWQFWLPQLPFMSEQFPGYPSYPLRDTYFYGWVGRFGWFEYGFSQSFYNYAFAIYLAIGGLAAAALWRARAALRARWAELTALVAAFVLTNLMIGIAGFRYREQSGDTLNFEQARYLLPMAGLYAAFIAAGVAGAGRRWGPAVGILVVILAGGNAIAALLLTVHRYYL